MKRLARGVDAAVQRVHSLLVDVMQPGLEAIAFALSDTAGLARCSPWTAPLCLKACLPHPPCFSKLMVCWSESPVAGASLCLGFAMAVFGSLAWWVAGVCLQTVQDCPAVFRVGQGSRRTHPSGR